MKVDSISKVVKKIPVTTAVCTYHSKMKHLNKERESHEKEAK